MTASLPGAFLAEWINGTPTNAARMPGTIERPPLAHYPVSLRVNGARSEGADLIEPAASLGVSIQAGIVWGHFWGHLPKTVRALDLNINDLEALLDSPPPIR